MNWSRLFSQIFFAVLVTGATGDVMFVVWFLCRKVLQNWNPKLVYYMLRWVVVMYILPITYLGIAFSYKDGYIQYNEGISKMMFVVDLNNLFFQGIAIIWLIVTVVIASKFIREEFVKYQVCKNNFDDGNSLAQTEFERIKQELGIKGHVELLRNDNPRLKSPFVTGIWKQKVVIPYFDYTEKELRVILYHELNHIKKKDIQFRYLTMVAIILNSINVVSYLLLEQVMLWSEADCDARVMDIVESQGMTTQRYYDMLFDMIGDDTKAPDLFYYPMMAGASMSLYRRMDIMQKYRESGKKIAKSVTVALTVAFAMISSVTAYAAGVDFAQTSDAYLEDNQEWVVYDLPETAEGWSDEMVIEPTEAVETVYINEGIMILGQGTIDWDIPAGTRYVTSSFYFTEGTKVQIACTALPSNCTYRFGLMHSSSTCYVVEGAGSGSYTFTVPSNGYYHIMVENRSSQTLSVTGGYSY